MNESLRHPLLDEHSRARLEAWREHPRAPRWSLTCGDRLREQDLEEVRLFASQCRAPSWTSFSDPPDGARDFADFCLREVPFYRARSGDSRNWNSISPCDRLDLAREPWLFVPDGLPLDEMVVYTTSGTTGSEARLPTHWRWPSTYLPLYERALALHHIDWPTLRADSATASRVALATIALQERTVTFAAWSSYLNGAALKVNLHPSQWRAPEDLCAFLDEANPQVLCGDPVSLGALADSDFAGRPLAIFSSAIALTPKARQVLEARFGCPVIDVYGTTESGPLAVSLPPSTSSTCEGAMAILPPDIWIEILRPDGSPCEEGETGEITLTGGRNPFLPLLRYRTGDFARGNSSPQVFEGAPLLLDFHGRALVEFDAEGREILDIDVTHALRDLSLREFSLHQSNDGSLHFQFRGGASPAEIESALRPVFPQSALRIEELSEWSRDARKLIRYSRDSL